MSSFNRYYELRAHANALLAEGADVDTLAAEFDACLTQAIEEGFIKKTLTVAAVVSMLASMAAKCDPDSPVGKILMNALNKAKSIQVDTVVPKDDPKNTVAAVGNALSDRNAQLAAVIRATQ